jgi:hypothetical protein
MGSAEMAAVAGGAMVGVGGVWVGSVLVGVAGKVALITILGVFVYVGKKGNDVRVAWVV